MAPKIAKLLTMARPSQQRKTLLLCKLIISACQECDDCGCPFAGCRDVGKGGEGGSRYYYYVTNVFSGCFFLAISLEVLNGF